MLVDSHCHLAGNYLDESELKLVLDRAYRAGVSGFINVGTNLDDCKLALTISKQYPEIQACVGIHPHEASSWNLTYIETLEFMIKDPNVRFIGETGLDWHYNLSSRNAQELAFRSQIQIAKHNAKPIMVHTRQAPSETIRILEEEDASQVGGIIHCFSENRAFARKALDLGFYLSFSGIVTFKNADQIKDVAAWAPLDRILVETDSPYLTPMPFRGKSNEPAMIVHTVNKISQLRHIPTEKLIDATTNNLETLCGWPSHF
jgi:TatD DNase family protein